MRLWSLHPKYLDHKGLTGLWREALLAKKIIEGKTKGYKYHPQMKRFLIQKDPLGSMNYFLYQIYKESKRRGYNFDKNKIGKFKRIKIDVTQGQLEHEFKHLKKKLKMRHPRRYEELSKVSKIVPNPIFRIVKGDVENWEKCSGV